MKRSFLLIVILPCFVFSQKNGAVISWKPAEFTLATRWAREVSPTNALPEYPRPQMVRNEWLNLNGLWDYAITDSTNYTPNDYQGKILVPYPIESALSGVEKQLQPYQKLWYRRTVELKEKKEDKKYLLHFGAVDYRATVYVNGEEVGNHTGGYQEFTFDITGALHKGINELIVTVLDPTNKGDNPKGKQTLNPAGIYYTPTSGIWQTVWMETVSMVFIENLKMTPDIDNSVLNLQVNVNGNATDYIIEASTSGSKATTSSGGGQMQLQVPKIHLWSPDDPYLYDLTIKLLHNGKVIDKVRSYYAMRKVEIRQDTKGKERIFLNNQYTYNLGVLDQGFWPDGIYTAPTDQALAFDIKAIKAMGFNTIRKHIKIEPARWYYHCDKLGMLVWQDMPYPAKLSPAARAEFEKECQENIKQLYNHPSIVCWVLFNEGWNSYDQERLTNWVKMQDPSRLVDGHSGENYSGDSPRDVTKKWIASDLADIHDYPGPNIAPALNGKARVLGEFGGIGVAVPYHEWNDLKGWGYVQLTASQLVNRYDSMVLKLKKLEEKGLTASIYTQPFDVEGEENGLLTYDREVIKIPLAHLRATNGTLVNQKGTHQPHFFLAKTLDPNDNDSRYNQLLAEFGRGRNDSMFLRRLVLMANRLNDLESVTDLSKVYFEHLKQPFSKGNLLVFRMVTHTYDDVGFQLFLKDSVKVNSVLGKFSAQNKIMDVITEQEVKPYLAPGGKTPDWNMIETKVINKFGELGRERMYMEQLAYYWHKSKWDSMSKYYVLYMQRAFDHSRININDASWDVFLHVSDTDILKFAVDIQKYNIEKFDKTAEALDTYASLLYKIGKIPEALEWEEKAVILAPDEKAISEDFAKMKKGEKTWD